MSPCLHLSLGFLCPHEHVVCVTLDVYAEITYVGQTVYKVIKPVPTSVDVREIEATI